MENKELMQQHLALPGMEGGMMKQLMDSNGGALVVSHVYAGFVYDLDDSLQDAGFFVCFGSDGHLYDVDGGYCGTLDEHFDVLVEQTGSRVDDPCADGLTRSTDRRE